MRIVVILLAVAILAACVPMPAGPVSVDQSTPAGDGLSPLAIPTLAPTEAAATGSGSAAADQSGASLVGRVVSSTLGNKPLSQTPVRLGRVFWNADKTDGAYVFEGGTSPSTITKADGTFVFAQVEPGDYVIAVGDLMSNNVVVRQPNKKVKIYSVLPGKTVDAGTLQLALP